ncbi:MAG TPA: hypothetical protein H9851_05395 [Candidatus Borkfalkia faecavium]|uniref:Uncharacterized protein n=1 Tax=Candidatus Borkfalkia faecavium TaxID=2838508 RepID=A0A9D1W1S8_9FIRM|nr:hypothetical protein [Candidatus Borkfalkia faecavium]
MEHTIFSFFSFFASREGPRGKARRLRHKIPQAAAQNTAHLSQDAEGRGANGRPFGAKCRQTLAECNNSAINFRKKLDRQAKIPYNISVIDERESAAKKPFTLTTHIFSHLF